jgi:hypothetical protein
MTNALHERRVRDGVERSRDDARALVRACEHFLGAGVILGIVDAALALGRAILEVLAVLIAALLTAFADVLIAGNTIGISRADPTAIECLTNFATSRENAGKRQGDECAKNDRGLHRLFSSDRLSIVVARTQAKCVPREYICIPGCFMDTCAMLCVAEMRLAVSLRLTQ